jgi:glycine/serine hydroxymethyltransferase
LPTLLENKQKVLTISTRNKEEEKAKRRFWNKVKIISSENYVKREVVKDGDENFAAEEVDKNFFD